MVYLSTIYTKSGDTGDTRLGDGTRVPKDQQRQAVKFLVDNAFATPTKIMNPVIVNRFQHTGIAYSNIYTCPYICTSYFEHLPSKNTCLYKFLYK